MQAVKEVLGGWQQSLFGEIEAYWLENPLPSRLTRQRKHPDNAIPQHNSSLSVTRLAQSQNASATPNAPTPAPVTSSVGTKRMETGKWRGRKIYVPQSQMNEIYMMVDRKCPYWETLKAIRKSPKPHHTDRPKL